MKYLNILLFIVGVLLTVLSCSKEKVEPEIPPPPPPPVVEVDSLILDPVFEIKGHSDVKNRIGGGDYTCDTLFLLQNIPDGEWMYTLKLGDSAQSGWLTVSGQHVKIANQQRIGIWLNQMENDSITFDLSLYCEAYPMKPHQQSFTFVNELYKIRTWQDLQAMAYDKMGQYALQNDIDFPERATQGFPEQGFVPIGTIGPDAAYLLNAFKGSLLGYGYTIRNFCIERADLNYVGLFGVLSDATVKDLTLDIAAQGLVGGNYVGAIAGYIAQKSIVENCKVVGHVTGINQIGGVAGYMERNSRVKLCRTTGNVKGQVNIGGIVGKTEQGSDVSTNFIEGEVSGIRYCGGIVGHNNSMIYNSQAGGELKTIQVKGGEFSGGIAGFNNGEILGCRVINGSIDGDKDVGGIVGFADTKSQCKESCAKVAVTGKTKVGGLLGSNFGRLNDSYAMGSVKGVSYVGGIVGDFHNEASNAYVSISVIGQDRNSCGAFVGSNTGTLVGCYFDKGQTALAKSVGMGSDFGVEAKLQDDFIRFNGVEIPRQIFVGWDFTQVWENEVPLANNRQFPGLKREFNFE